MIKVIKMINRIGWWGCGGGGGWGLGRGGVGTKKRVAGSWEMGGEGGGGGIGMLSTHNHSPHLTQGGGGWSLQGEA